MILYQPRKIWYVDFEFYKLNKDVSLIHKFWNTKDILACVDDNDPVIFHMTREHLTHKYFSKFLLEKLGEI